MATAKEVVGRSGSIDEDAESVRPWVSYDAINEADATAAVAATAPATIGGQVLSNISYAEKIADHYECRATYRLFKRQPPKQKGESSFSFEFATTPVRVYLPIGTQSVFKRSSDNEPTPVIHIIGDQGIPNHQPEGVEIFEPTHTESETHYVDPTFVTTAYKVAVKKLIGKVNNATFKGHDAGEVLLSSVSGAQRGADDWEIRYSWSVKENQDTFDAAGIVVQGGKKGWEYLWPRYVIAEDENGAPTLTQQIRYLVRAQVFRTGNFATLNIGT